jgi:hypothetical protein
VEMTGKTGSKLRAAVEEEAAPRWTCPAHF